MQRTQPIFVSLHARVINPLTWSSKGYFMASFSESSDGASDSGCRCDRKTARKCLLIWIKYCSATSRDHVLICHGHRQRQHRTINITTTTFSSFSSLSSSSLSSTYRPANRPANTPYPACQVYQTWHHPLVTPSVPTSSSLPSVSVVGISLEPLSVIRTGQEAEMS